MDWSGIVPFHLCVRTGGLADALLPRKFDANFPVALYWMLRKAHNWIAHWIPETSYWLSQELNPLHIAFCSAIQIAWLSGISTLTHTLLYSHVKLIWGPLTASEATWDPQRGHFRLFALYQSNHYCLSHLSHYNQKFVRMEWHRSTYTKMCPMHANVQNHQAVLNTAYLMNLQHKLHTPGDGGKLTASGVPWGPWTCL